MKILKAPGDDDHAMRGTRIYRTIAYVYVNSVYGCGPPVVSVGDFYCKRFSDRVAARRENGKWTAKTGRKRARKRGQDERARVYVCVCVPYFSAKYHNDVELRTRRSFVFVFSPPVAERARRQRIFGNTHVRRFRIDPAGVCAHRGRRS